MMISRDNKKLMERCRWIFGEGDLHLGPESGDKVKNSGALIRKWPVRARYLQMRSLFAIKNFLKRPSNGSRLVDTDT